ncbi:MAG: hypothetical protein A4E63_00169 [Syntrophorhabdus sp. PtaU1.Bin050]|nr:MAG: hypothetical protein A4E63_00169 [Syntrophorhabdus sp. PtaU1.Bin050]
MTDNGKTVLIIGTCDTKGEEIGYMKGVLESQGVRGMTLDLGLANDPAIKVDISARQLAEKSGKTLEGLREAAKAGRYEEAVENLAAGAVAVVRDELLPNRTIDGVIAIGGSMGSAISLLALRTLPVGFPKMLISTVALSEFLHPTFVKSDILLAQPISDFFGLSDWSKRDLNRAAVSMASIVKTEKPMEDGPWIAITQLGWLQFTPAIKKALEQNGFKVALAHAVSMQPGIMEQLIRQGVIKGFLDLCPFEITHEIVGPLAAISSRNRMDAAAEAGIPQVVTPGVFGGFTYNPRFTEKFSEEGRFVIPHNEILGTGKLSVAEMEESALVMASRLNKAKGPVVVVVPTQGLHHYDAPDKMYYFPEGRKVLIEVLTKNLRPDIEQIILDCHINDKEYSDKVIEAALRLFKGIPR